MTTSAMTAFATPSMVSSGISKNMVAASRGHPMTSSLPHQLTASPTVGSGDFSTSSQVHAGAAATAAAAAALVLGQRRQRRRPAAVSLAAEATAKATPKTGRSIAKETLARLRRRSPKGGNKDTVIKRMPPRPDPWEIDEDGNKVFPWPKSFAEIVQTAACSTINLFLEGETRVEVCFPPLPLADLNWNGCDMTESRVVDSNTQHAIAFSKLLIKDPRLYPKLDPKTTAQEAGAGAAPLDEDAMAKLLERRFKKKPDTDQRRTVRVLFPTKPLSLRARDMHYEKWRKMERPELLRRGYYNEVNEEAYPGPFEDVFVYIMTPICDDLIKVRNYIEKADAVATKQGRVLRHVIFNLNLNKLRGDIQFYRQATPLKFGQATPKVQFDFFCTFRNAYFIRFDKFCMTIMKDPFNVLFQGALYHAYPSCWQTFMLDTKDGTYRTIDVSAHRPALVTFKRRLIRAFGLMKEGGLSEDPITDDLYRGDTLKAAGTIRVSPKQFQREGAGEWMWWEAFGEEVSDKWRM
eukprot:TRINITY_DN93454_c0_g1_i1.p1 TRINITY_DN93454_c0_g1~~TRINITY_DN93454_c0_g1_i1.p1  ORF type:complete len:543 (+),score=95.76 TRINITY_DN93454_c0_g1_i1:70-1629(+)